MERDATYPLNTCTNEIRRRRIRPQLRTRPSPPTPRGDEILEPLISSLMSATSGSRLSFPAYLSFSYQGPHKLAPRITHGFNIASPAIRDGKTRAIVFPDGHKMLNRASFDRVFGVRVSRIFGITFWGPYIRYPDKPAQTSTNHFNFSVLRNVLYASSLVSVVTE